MLRCRRETGNGHDLGNEAQYFCFTDYLLQVFFQLLSISHRTRMRIVVIYDVIILKLCLLFSRILIDYEKNENKTPSKIYTITVCKEKLSK